jgi:surface antigen
MADKQITDLTLLAGVDLASTDLLLVVDVSASEDKKIEAGSLASRVLALAAGSSIPVGSIAFTAQSVDGSALINGSVVTDKLDTGAVTAVKLSDDSGCVVATTLPASGDFRGQLAFTSGDFLYVWGGSSWVEVKAPGSINEVLGNGTGNIVNITVSTTSSGVALDVNLDNTTAGSQFLAGPVGTGGAVAYRTISGDDLPTASDTAKGAVTVDGEGLRLDGTKIEIDNDIAAGTSYSLVTYDTKGLVTDGRAITSGDLPVASAGSIGGVYPGTGLAVDANGQLSHSNTTTPGTYTKIEIDGEGHVITGTSLVAADIPGIPAERLNSGTLSIDRIGTNAITGAKLGNASTVKFGGAGSTTGVVTFPTPEFAGQYFWDASNNDLYLYDGNTWQAVTITSGELVFGGTYSADTNLVDSITTAGGAAGLTVGGALPAASDTNSRYYVVVSESGTGASPAPVESLAPPDMLLSNGSTWELIDVSNAIAGQTAGNISFTPYGNLAANNVQTALQELDDEKVAKAGDTITGELLIGTTGSLKFEGATANAYETEIAVTDPTLDRTVTIPDQSGNFLISGNASIVDADISASAAIAFSKLASLSSGNILVGNGSNVAASVAVSGDITLSNAGVAAIASGVIVDADISATAEIAVSKLADGAARQLLQTAANGTDVEWTSNVDVPGTLDVTGIGTFDAATRGAISTLSYGATVTPDFAVANQFTLTLTGNATLANPSNLTAGQSGVIYLVQDGTGSRTLAYGSQYDFEGGTAPTLSTAASSVDVLVYSVRSSTSIVCRLLKAFS